MPNDPPWIAHLSLIIVYCIMHTPYFLLFSWIENVIGQTTDLLRFYTS